MSSLRSTSRAALASHQASGSTPYWGNYVRPRMEEAVAVDFLNLAYLQQE